MAIAELIFDSCRVQGPFLTIDVRYLGRRLNELRNNFNMLRGMEYPNLFPGLSVGNLDDGNEIMDYGTVHLRLLSHQN